MKRPQVGPPQAGKLLTTLPTLAALLLLHPLTAQAGPAASHAEQAHARALDSFRQGRFPEAYGRFVALADAGHGGSARFALLMCEQGPALFGKDWDCGPEQVQDWARAAGVAAPRVVARLYPAAAPAAARR
jgi:hypothetical protein